MAGRLASPATGSRSFSTRVSPNSYSRHTVPMLTVLAPLRGRSLVCHSSMRVNWKALHSNGSMSPIPIRNMVQSAATMNQRRRQWYITHLATGVDAQIRLQWSTTVGEIQFILSGKSSRTYFSGDYDNTWGKTRRLSSYSSWGSALGREPWGRSGFCRTDAGRSITDRHIKLLNRIL